MGLGARKRPTGQRPAAGERIPQWGGWRWRARGWSPSKGAARASYLIRSRAGDGLSRPGRTHWCRLRCWRGAPLLQPQPRFHRGLAARSPRLARQVAPEPGRITTQWPRAVLCRLNGLEPSGRRRARLCASRRRFGPPPFTVAPARAEQPLAFSLILRRHQAG
jgi:hypothetical protein